MEQTIYAIPEEAEEAFYWAFEHADVAAMMRVWARLSSIECVHPMGEIVRGPDAVRRSWQQIFATGAQMRLRISDRHISRDSMLSIHTLYEHITVTDSKHGAHGRVAATNIYQLTEQGWLMILHHASPASRTTQRHSESVPPPLH